MRVIFLLYPQVLVPVILWRLGNDYSAIALLTLVDFVKFLTSSTTFTFSATAVALFAAASKVAI